MRELPRIVPRVQRPGTVECEPHGYAFMPCPLRGPLALILSTRAGTGQRIVTLADAAALARIVTDDGADLSQLQPGDLCDIALTGWPEDWGPHHVAWGLIDAMARALTGGLPWQVVAERALVAHLRSRADLN